MNTRSTAFAALAIGTLCTLQHILGRNQFEPDHDPEARVVTQDENFTAFEFTDPDMALSHGTVNLYHDDGQSPSGVWSFGEVVHEPEVEDAPEVVEEPKALAVNLPRGAAWLMETAKVLDDEATKYGENHSYGAQEYNIITHIRSAANTLRSVVGAALTIEAK